MAYTAIDVQILNGSIMEQFRIRKKEKVEEIIYPDDRHLPKDERIIARFELRDDKYCVWMYQGSRSNRPKVFEDTEEGYSKALEYFYDMIQEERYMHFFAKGVMV